VNCEGSKTSPDAVGRPANSAPYQEATPSSRKLLVIDAASAESADDASVSTVSGSSDWAHKKLPIIREKTKTALIFFIVLLSA
jgi:hypothetical protein